MCSMKSSPTIVLPGWMATEIATVAQEHNETGGVILAGRAGGGGGVRLLGRELYWVPEVAYDRRTTRALTIRSAGYVDALARADERGDVPIWIHTHPGWDADPRRSKYDRIVDGELHETFRIRSGAAEYASLVFSPADPWFTFTGIVWGDEDPEAIGRLVIVGDRWAMISADDAPTEGQVPVHFDRQVRAFGGDVQRVLAQLRIAVVGSGGTGSATAEQLARLGVGSLLLIDPKDLSESNPTRVYGSTPEDVSHPKVEVLASHIRRVAPAAHIDSVIGTVTDEGVARLLTACDVVFGCTDDNAGRLVLSRLPTYYLTPVIDVGVLLSSTNGRLEGIDGRITILTPASACLVCRDRIDIARAGAEQLPPDERASRQAEGYAPELGGVEPAVIAYTSAVASFAVAELLERLIGYGPDPEPGEILVRCHDREISTNTAEPKPQHYCNPATGLLGAGDREPFLGQTWRA
jgi:molybdopterin/thiamine biosynthesis adenylyltransferase